MNSATRTSILIILCILPAVCTTAQTRITFDSVLNSIRRQNPVLKSYEALAGAMEDYAKGASGWSAPEAGGGLWMVPYRRMESGQDRGQFMLSVQQKITNPAKLRAGQRYADSRRPAEEERKLNAYRGLKMSAGKLWVQWIVLEKRKKILSQDEDLVSLMLNLAKARYPNGQGKLGEVYRTEGKLEEIRNQIIANSSEIARRNSQLAQLMNITPSVKFEIDTAFSPEQLVFDSAGLASGRSDIRAIDREIELMGAKAALEDAQNKPDFSLSFSHMIPRSSAMPGQFMLVGMMSIPIAPWTSKTYKANQKGIGQEIRSLRAQREALVTETRATYTALQGEIKSLALQVKNSEQKIMPVMKRNFELELLSYRENKGELSAVLEAWESWNASRLQHLETMMTYYEKLVEQSNTLEH